MARRSVAATNSLARLSLLVVDIIYVAHFHCGFGVECVRTPSHSVQLAREFSKLLQGSHNSCHALGDQMASILSCA